MKPARKTSFFVWIVFIVALIGLALHTVQKRRKASAPNDTLSAERSNRFAWVPSYPGARFEGIRTIQRGEQLTYMYDFRVKDDGARVQDFYTSKLKGAGFTVIGKGGPAGKSWDLYAENSDRTRSVDVNGNAQPEGVKVGVVAVVR